MRSTILQIFALAAVGACAPDIAPGAYLCGPEQVCPDEQVCDGETATCVLPSQAKPFACPASSTDVEPNDDPNNAQVIPSLTCASRPAEVIGCTRDVDGEDWFQFDVPAACTTVGVDLRLTFPIAFELLELELRNGSGVIVATGTPCAQAEPDDGDDQSCLEHALTPGEHYTVRVARTGEGDCGGACAYNRYTLTLQLETP
jgi:hypothetical protein